jgi:hypothetical protein
MLRNTARFDVIHDGVSPTARIWIARDRRHEDFLTESKVKVPGGIRHLVTRWRGAPTVKAVTAATLTGGFLSARPYQLAQACDGSIGLCALALFEDFCTARRLDPASLVRSAYPEEPRDGTWSLAGRRALRRDAEWEGVAFPDAWTPDAVRGLIESLHEINYHALASVVQDLPHVPVLTSDALALAEAKAMDFAFARPTPA